MSFTKTIYRHCDSDDLAQYYGVLVRNSNINEIIMEEFLHNGATDRHHYTTPEEMGIEWEPIGQVINL